MKLKCLKFCFLNSVAFCARTQIKQTQSCKGFLESHQEHFSFTTSVPQFATQGPGFSGFSRIPSPVFLIFCRVPGPGFLVFQGLAMVPLESMVTIFRVFQGPAGVPLGSRIPVFRYATPEICLKVCLNFQQMGFVTIQVFKYAHMVTSKSTQE